MNLVRRFNLAPVAVLALLAAGCFPPVPEGETSTSAAVTPAGTMTAVTGFANPGALDMYEYVPGGALSGALVVALHGCTQSASAYVGAGWSSAADVYGMVVLYPEQVTANNENRCFNWYDQDDTLRNGESLSIVNAVQASISAHGLDAQRVYVTGLSAGGAMTAVLLAGYPDKGTSNTTFTGFAGGAVMAGLPFESACTGADHTSCPTGSAYGDAFTAMNPGKNLTPAQWGDRVRSATPNAHSWPRVSVWGGTSDTTVAPMNVSEIVDQFTNVNGVSATPTTTDTVEGQAHQSFADASGGVRVETYRVSGMPHGTAIDPAFDFGVAGKSCGTAQAYILDKGICSTYYALKFWNEADAVATTTPPTTTPPTTTPPLTVACSAATSSNYAHVQAGRAHDSYGMAYANGSNASLGLDNLFFHATLHSTTPGVWALGACP